MKGEHKRRGTKRRRKSTVPSRSINWFSSRPAVSNLLRSGLSTVRNTPVDDYGTRISAGGKARRSADRDPTGLIGAVTEVFQDLDYLWNGLEEFLFSNDHSDASSSTGDSIAPTHRNTYHIDWAGGVDLSEVPSVTNFI